MTETDEIRRAIHERADRLTGRELEEFGRAIFFAGCSIIGQAEGAESLSRTAFGISLTAGHAMREGERNGRS